MRTFENVSLFLLRVGVGWLMFYAGITKVLNPVWSAEGYLRSAKTFPGFYQWLAGPGILPVINFVNEWGLTMLGVSLILGIAVRLSSVLGAVLMILYWFPVLQFPYVEHGFLVDDHVVYALVLLYFAAVRAGRVWGLESWCANLPICRKFSKYHVWVG
jgi:thiosulfate dehydrogenase [quinone] large subunit